jgi:hypothetical protein
MSDIDIEIVDFLDLINFTLSDEFIDKWRFRFSIKFLKEFQAKVIKSLKDRKPIKIDSLFKHLSKKCGYSPDQVKNFFEAIDIKIYHPLVLGKASSLALS